jgi:hypothetical protein
MRSTWRFLLGSVGVVAVLLVWARAVAQPNLPKFREQVVDLELGDCWSVCAADVNADGKPDIVAVSYKPARVVWYENPTFKRRVIVEKEPAMPAWVQPLDVDGDGKVELILAAEYYEPLDTTKGGSVWLVQRPDDLDRPWTPIKIDAEPTMHRIHLVDLEGKGKPDLVCSSLLGGGGQGASLYVLRRPPNPFKDGWARELISRELHVIHNTWSIDWDRDGKQEVLAASREGITLFKRVATGKWDRQRLSAGYQSKQGSSEVAVGRLPGGKRYLAAIEPHHGHEAVIYTAPDRPDQPWKRKLLLENRGGHTVWPADLTGTGVDSLLVGFVGLYGNRPGGPIVYLFQPLDADGDRWDKIVLDDKQMPGEDGLCADLNDDGRLDVVVGGGSKVKVFWNMGKP